MQRSLVEFGREEWVENPMSGNTSPVVSEYLFGGISLNAQDRVGETPYVEHYEGVHRELSLNYVRYPDGEMPDGFVVERSDGSWGFRHNNLNNGNSQTFSHPITGETIRSGFELTQDYIDALPPAFSLKYPELIHEGLLESGGRQSFTESLEFAVSNNSAFSLVLPEFEYLKIPVNRTLSDGTRLEFNPTDHIYYEELKDDLKLFLENVFLNGSYNSGVLPEPMILELGNEDFFGWNSSFFSRDSGRDLDSYSAYSLACLEAISEFREGNEGVDFIVSLQAHGGNYVQELYDNFEEAEATHLFAEVNMIDVMHVGLSATVDTVRNIEENWTITSGIQRLRDIVEAEGGSIPDGNINMSAWSAAAVAENAEDLGNFSLSSASSLLSLFSGLAELGFGFAANWGIGAWRGFGTQATNTENGEVRYSPYAELLRSMEESIVGTRQVQTDLMDVDQSSDYSVYAFEDDAKGVMFVSANNFSGDIELEVSGFGEFSSIWYERISVEENTQGESQTVVTRGIPEMSMGVIALSINQPYEVLRVIVARSDAGQAGLHLWGGDQGSDLRGGLGQDLVEGGVGSDFLRGDSGDDILVGGLGSDTLRGGEGADEIYCGIRPGSNRYVTDYEISRDLASLAGSGVDRVSAGSGNDTVHGGFENTRVYLNQGDDLFNGDANYDSPWGDSVFGGYGNDTIYGASGNDMLRGQWGDDVIFGGVGDDTVFGGDGRDSVHLGSGDDIFYDTPQHGRYSRDTVFGGHGDDTIHGGGGNDVFNGQSGNDEIWGGNGFDTISAGLGQDTVYGGNGRDLVFLNVGDDIFYDNWQSGSFAQDTVFAGYGNDTINGGGGNDVFHGQWGNDLLFGGTGNDLLFGGEGRDTIRAGAGNDTVFGGADQDFIELGQGDDRYVDRVPGGYSSNDTISGGEGSDEFVFYANTSEEVITDFEIGSDRLTLSSSLCGGRNVSELVSENLQFNDNGVFLIFSDDQSIFLEGITSSVGLESDITIL